MENNSKIFHVFAKLLDGKTATLRFKTPRASTRSVKRRIFALTGIPIPSQRLISGGRQLSDESVLTAPDATVHVLLRLRGGKGGFGSLLRGAATKAGQKKTNNFDACRDMSGRRLRHVNAEKRLEEWKADEEERRLERIAEEFLKKNEKKGKKGAGDGEAERYVKKYREVSARCAKEVEEAVREACGGHAKRKGKGEADADAVEAKKLKIWMGKRKLDESDSDSSDDDGENEKSTVLDNESNSDSNEEHDGGSSESVTGGKLDGDYSAGVSCESGSEEEKEAFMEQSLKSSPPAEMPSCQGERVVESMICEEMVICVEAAVAPEVGAVKVGSYLQPTDSLSLGNMETAMAEATEFSSSQSEVTGKIPAANSSDADSEKPVNLDEYSSAAELEVLGMEKLKTELQSRGLKCGGTLQERAARLFLLKTTPLDKLPKKLLAKK